MTENGAQQLEQERGVYYGDPRWNHENLGIVWGGLLRSAGIGDGTPVPTDVVVLMMASLKLVRAAQRKPFHQDNYDDAQVYVRFAERFKREDSPAG